MSFENKIALVTGAASELGLATAKAFAESDASVVLADWNEKAVRSAAEELKAQGAFVSVTSRNVRTTGA
jgi:NAD(P)-dependent dehydrogenase (short-subunit alcohol dehydrogenase family)